MLTFDQGRQRVLLVLGDRLQELTGTEARSVPFGQGCGAPCRFAARARPRTGEAGFGLELSAGGPRAVVFALGFGQGSRPLGNGCILLVQQTLATAFAAADARGFAQLSLPLPGNHALRGLVMVGQAGVLDPAAAGGFRLSAGLSLTVGD